MSSSRVYLTCAETAKLVRTALKEAFPGQTFRVQSKVYSGGASITVSWQDGPTQAEVKRVVEGFEGADFDGMTDTKTYRTVERNGQRVHFGADYIFTSRSFSAPFLRAVAEQVARKYGHRFVPIVEERGDGREAWIRKAAVPVCRGARETLERAIYNAAHETSA